MNNTSVQSPNSGKSTVGSRIVIGITVGLVVVPLLWTWVPLELARWFISAAQENELADDLPAAIANVDSAIAWTPRKADFFAYRAHLKLDQKQFADALADVTSSLELKPEKNVYALYNRMLINQRQGDHTAALKDADEIVRLAADGPSVQSEFGFGMSYENALNVRAYGRALANTEIEEGLADIENAIQRLGGESWSFIDTRGYLHYLAGDYESARSDMERAVELAEASMEAFQEMPKPKDDVEWQRQRQLYEEDLAVLYHHRGLVYEKLALAELAEKDLRRAAELGYSPEDGVW